MNRVEVLERMAPVLNTQVRTIDTTPATRVAVTPDAVILRPGRGQHHIEMTKGGAESMANFIGLPWNLAAKLRPETFGQVSTELLGRTRRYSIMTQDGAITGFHKPTEFRTLNPDRVLRSIESGIRGLEYHRVLILGNFVVSLELIGERREAVIAGDLIQAGAQISFSPIGTVDPSVRSYALRLVCTNGATSNTTLREFHYGGGGGAGGSGGEGDDVWQWFRRSARDAYNSLHQIVERYRQMMNEEIPANDRAAMLEAMLRNARITGNDANAIRAMAIDTPPANTYELMNLLSNATSHLLEDPRRVRKAQDTVANFTGEKAHARVCPVCRSRRN